MVLTRFVVLISIYLPTLLAAQPVDSVKTPAINTNRLMLFSIGAGTVYTGSLIGLSELWYKNSAQQNFSFFNDTKEWKQLDKMGHFYSTFYSSAATAKALRWSNVKQTKANLIGALTGCLLMVPIEVLDGFSKEYGASTSDLVANAGGAAFYYAQATLWKEIRIWPKFSYHTTQYAALRPNILGDNNASRVLKDYNGQTYWFSIDVDKFMEFSKWLNVAVGYGAERMVYARDNDNRLNGYDAYRQYYLSFDLDLTSIKTKSKALKTILFFANMIKIPAPTVEFSKRGISFYSFYF